MTDSEPFARRMGYWDDLDRLDDSLVDLLDRVAGSDWRVTGAEITGQDDGDLFTLVVRRRDGDAEIVRIGYAIIDLGATVESGDDLDDVVSWSERYIDLRSDDETTAGLAVLAKALSEGDLSDDDPMTVDARGDGLGFRPEIMSDPVSEIYQIDAEPDRTQTAVCHDCGAERDLDDLDKIGGDMLPEPVFVCSEGCDA